MSIKSTASIVRMTTPDQRAPKSFVVIAVYLLVALSSTHSRAEGLCADVFKSAARSVSIQADLNVFPLKSAIKKLDPLYRLWIVEAVTAFEKLGFSVPNIASVKRSATFAAEWNQNVIRAVYVDFAGYYKQNILKELAITHEVAHLVWRAKTAELMSNYWNAIKKIHGLKAGDHSELRSLERDFKSILDFEITYEELFADVAAATVTNHWQIVKIKEPTHDKFRDFASQEPLPWTNSSLVNFPDRGTSLKYYRLAEVRRFIYSRRLIEKPDFLHALAKALAGEFQDLVGHRESISDKEMNRRLIERIERLLADQ